MSVSIGVLMRTGLLHYAMDIREVLMGQVHYLTEATNLKYSADALGYIGGKKVKEGITLAAETLHISAGAIAGAMAEERMSYDLMQQLLDDYARYGRKLTAEELSKSILFIPISDDPGAPVVSISKCFLQKEDCRQSNALS